MEEALECKSDAGNRPLEGSGETVVGTGRGLEGEDPCRCADIAVRVWLQGWPASGSYAASMQAGSAINKQSDDTGRGMRGFPRGQSITRT